MWHGSLVQDASRCVTKLLWFPDLRQWFPDPFQVWQPSQRNLMRNVITIITQQIAGPSNFRIWTDSTNFWQSHQKTHLRCLNVLFFTHNHIKSYKTTLFVDEPGPQSWQPLFPVSWISMRWGCSAHARAPERCKHICCRALPFFKRQVTPDIPDLGE